MIAEELYEGPIVPVKKPLITDNAFSALHHRLNTAETKLTLLLWLVGGLAVMMFAVMIKVFTLN